MFVLGLSLRKFFWNKKKVDGLRHHWIIKVISWAFFGVNKLDLNSVIWDNWGVWFIPVRTRPKFFPIPNFFKTESKTFLYQIFSRPNSRLFIPNFFETDSKTLLYQFFSKSNQIPEKMEKTPNREVSKPRNLKTEKFWNQNFTLWVRFPESGVNKISNWIFWLNIVNAYFIEWIFQI